MQLPEAAVRYSVSRLRVVLQSGVRVDECGSDGRTALFRAARVGRTEHVRLLLEFGANPNATDNKGEAPLQAAARYGHLECVKHLVEAGTQLDYCPDPKLTAYSESALCSAARKGHAETVDYLLRKGASPNAASLALRLPLISAAWWGHLDICKQLVSAGARLETKSKSGTTALHEAVKGADCDENTRVKIVRALVEMNANVNAQDEYNRTPIHWAVILNSDQSVPLLYELLKGRPNLSLRDSSGETALDLDEVKNDKEIEELLIAAGAKKVKKEEPETVIRIDDQVNLILVRGGWKPPVEKRDQKLAEEICMAKPALVKNYGWDASPRHWHILFGCSRPIPLERIAYFARGYRNVPLGEELKDGIDALGESYQQAVDRFVSLRLLRILTPTELVRCLARVTDLKQIARLHGLKLPVLRDEMLEAVLAKIAPEEFSDVLKKGPYFVVTPKAEQLMRKREHVWLSKFENRLKEQLISALAEPNLRWGLLVYSNLKALRHYSAKISPEQVCKCRLVLENPIPEGIVFQKEQEALLRAIAVASHLYSYGGEDWSHWGNVSCPRAQFGEPMSPWDFASAVMEPEQTADFQGDVESDD